MKTVIIGGSGQIGHHLAAEMPEAIVLGRPDIDLTDTAGLTQRLKQLQPDTIINAAAYTAVDRAEEEPQLAWTVNAAAPAALAATANETGARLIHYSTDYVFDGRSEAAYTDDAPVLPLSVYGQTKLAGDLAVAAICRNYWTLRVGWVFGAHGSNFVKTMLRVAAEGRDLQVVADQHGTPSHAGQIARATANLLREEEGRQLPSGTYHLPGGPITSWHGFAEEIFSRALATGVLHGRPNLSPITTAEYPTAAVRPENAALAISPTLARHLSESLDWRDGLSETLAQLNVDG